MKKIFAMLLSAALIASAAVSASAATIGSATEPDNKASVEVKGVYSAGTAAETKYSVDVEWGSMTFTYHAGGKTWNPDTHREDEAAGTWTAEGNTITVTNHSNTGITVNYKFTDDNVATGITAAFDENSQTIATAAETLPANAPSVTNTLTISGGSIASTATTATKIGSITVTIS